MCNGKPTSNKCDASKQTQGKETGGSQVMTLHVKHGSSGPPTNFVNPKDLHAQT